MERGFYQGADREAIEREVSGLSDELRACLAQYKTFPHSTFPDITVDTVPLGQVFPRDANGQEYAAQCFLLSRKDGLSDTCSIDLQLLQIVLDKQGPEQVEHLIMAELLAHCEGMLEWAANNSDARH